MKLLSCIFLLFAFIYASGEQLLIGAFNIQVFGKSKMSKPEVVAVLVQIVQRYDVLVVQEIRDVDMIAFPSLVDEVNDASTDHYEFVQSERTGRTSSKEQYGYIYKTSKVRVIGEYQYPDQSDVFEREPYSVQFERVTSSGNQRQFSFVALHAKPDDAVAEIDALVPVYDVVASKFGEDVLLGGDFNADCSYVCSSCWDRIGLWTDDRFDWLIGSSVDTTVSSNDCTYDRLVIAGSDLKDNAGKASAFYFDREYGLTEELAKDVSDHYPVEFYLN